jgi:P63C domain
MNEDKLPLTDFTGFITVAGKNIPCAVLYPESENPIRVLVQREVVGLLTGNKKGGLDRYLSPQNLQQFLPEQFKNKSLEESTYSFKAQNGRKAQGFQATDLIDICHMYMKARNAGALSENQKHLAEISEIIILSFAKTGIIAVIDQQTGYNEVQERFYLNRILEKYIEEEARKWAKRFPDEFYKLIFKLNNWSFTEESIKKRPGVVGRWTNQIIYNRFPKGLLGKLEDKNPSNAGYRRFKHHQFLTDIGNEDLKEYISNAIFLMKASSNWKKFWQLLARANGKPYQAELFD